MSRSSSNLILAVIAVTGVVRCLILRRVLRDLQVGFGDGPPLEDWRNEWLDLP